MSTSFAAAWPKNWAPKAGCFRFIRKNTAAPSSTVDHQMVLETEIFKYGLNLSHVFYTLARIVAPVLIRWGTEEQKNEFLEPIMRAQICVWQVLTEPHGGSDIANCQTKAIRDGDHYVVNGQKVMVGHHLPPDYLWTLVCTNPQGKRHENLAWLHIPANLPGITIQHMNMMMGIKNAVFFDNVRVPAKYLIGGENNGWKVASTHMELEHGGDGRIAADPLIERVVEYCRKTHIEDKPIIEDPRVRDLIAEMTIELNTLAALQSADLLAPLRQKTASLRRPAAALLSAHAASAQRRAPASDHGRRRPGAESVRA